MLNEIKRDAIAGHKSAIYTCVRVIGDLIPLLQCTPLVEILINQYWREIKILNKELLKMEKQCVD